VSGGTLKAKNSASDFCLVQINSNPPAACNVYYSGWNRTLDNSITGTAYGIHHPSGDIKKFSYSTTGASTTTYLNNTVPGDGSHWRITSWSDGTTTEGGSSGSPLYDNNHRIIGQLHGGYAACNNTSSDWYGKFGVSWTGGGSNTTRLSNWLDPGNTGATVLNGYDPGVTAAPVANFTADVTSSCTGTVVFTDQSTNTPTSWSWIFGDGGTSNAQNPVHHYTANGVYSVSLTASNASGNNSITKTNYITINKPSGPSVTGATVCNPSSATLSASGSGTIKWYNSPGSSTVLHTGNTFTTPVLSNTTTYYAEDNITGAVTHGGKADTTGGGGMFTQPYVHYNVFNCYIPLVLQTVKIYANAAQTGKVITLQNASGTILATATVNLSAGINTVTLNFSLPVDTGLRLVGPASPGWYRNSSGVVYPLTTAGKFSIIRSSAGPPATNPYYYYFYDWVVKENNCISTRTPVTANVINCAALPETENPVVEVMPNPVNDILYIHFDRIPASVYHIEIFNLLGQSVHKQSNVNLSGDFRQAVDVRHLLKGIYVIRIKTNNLNKTFKFNKI